MNGAHGYQQNGNMPNAAPYGNGAAYGGASVHVGGGVPNRSVYQQSQSVMASAGASGAAYKKRLSNFLGDDDAASESEAEQLSKEDMLKLQKDKKKVAKANNNIKKKM
jgi:hypothetical protein